VNKHAFRGISVAIFSVLLMFVFSVFSAPLFASSSNDAEIKALNEQIKSLSKDIKRLSDQIKQLKASGGNEYDIDECKERMRELIWKRSDLVERRDQLMSEKQANP